MTGTSGVPADLLTAKPDKEARQLQAAAEEVSKVNIGTKEARIELKRHLQTLRESLVWNTLKAYFKGEQINIEQFIREGSNPNELLKYSGELKMLKKLLDWPELMLRTIDQLDTHAAQLEAKQKEQPNAGERRSR